MADDNQTTRPLMQAESENMDRSVTPPVMVRGTMVKRSGAWAYNDGTVYSDDATNFRVSALGVDIADVSNSDAGDFRVSSFTDDAAQLRTSAFVDSGSISAMQDDASNLMVSARSDDANLFRVSSINAVQQPDGGQLRTSAIQEDAANLRTSSIIQGYTGTTFQYPRIDSATFSLQTVDYEHHEIHSGSHFYIEDVSDIAINNVFDVQWTTPNTTTWAHFTFELNCEAETEWYIYEAPTINTNGTAMTPINNNRNSSDTSQMAVSSISNTSVANANADTQVSAATEIAHGIVGAGKNGGLINRSNEIILKQNTIYCYRAIANIAGYTNFRMSWYEHAHKE